MRIRNGFEEFFFCLRSNLSNESITSALRPGLKTGMDFIGLVSGLKTGAENYIFWSEIVSEFGEPGGIRRIFWSEIVHSPPPPRLLNRLAV